MAESYGNKIKEKPRVEGTGRLYLGLTVLRRLGELAWRRTSLGLDLFYLC